MDCVEVIARDVAAQRARVAGAVAVRQRRSADGGCCCRCSRGTCSFALPAVLIDHVASDVPRARGGRGRLCKAVHSSNYEPHNERNAN
eukprot:5972137-Prymnesium_polylepis.1